MNKPVIAGVGMTHFGKFLSSSLKLLSEQAVNDALRDARLTAEDIQCVSRSAQK